MFKSYQIKERPPTLPPLSHSLLGDHGEVVVRLEEGNGGEDDLDVAQVDAQQPRHVF